jgi:probable HAF family extracellular repeat protein
MWDGNTAINLNDFLDPITKADGWVLNAAQDINDLGWIVGTAGNTRTGATHAFLLSVNSVPEPGTISLTLAGIGLILTLRRKKKSVLTGCA